MLLENDLQRARSIYMYIYAKVVGARLMRAQHARKNE